MGERMLGIHFEYTIYCRFEKLNVILLIIYKGFAKIIVIILTV